MLFEDIFNFIPYLCSGEYSICVSLEDRGGDPIKYYDYVECPTTVSVVSDREYFGVFHTPAEVSIIENIGNDYYE